MGHGGENGTARGDSATDAELHRTRFGTYFPRVLAFAHSLTADETTAKDAAVEAFASAFAQRADPSEEEFIVRLFYHVREHCRRIGPAGGDSDRLSRREREILALVFDARLDRAVVRRLMQATEQAISATLLTALRKIRIGASSTATPRSLRIA